eukprot:Selendium_serpulae@DN11446_c0_g1_i1.p1
MAGSPAHVELLNDEGAPVALGLSQKSRNLWYCGRTLGAAHIPNSNGQCGPYSGPQCTSCTRFQDAYKQAHTCRKRYVNDEGAPIRTGNDKTWSHLWYCGRFMGPGAIAGSDGICGPDNGPQCDACKRFQKAISALTRFDAVAEGVDPTINDEGVPCHRGVHQPAYFFCNRVFTDPRQPAGQNLRRCGPDGGTQCPSCHRFTASTVCGAAVVTSATTGTRGVNTNPATAAVTTNYSGDANKDNAMNSVVASLLEAVDEAARPGQPDGTPPTLIQTTTTVEQTGPGFTDAHGLVNVKRGKDDRWYCGRRVGVRGSHDGICGPHTGPQCESCLQFEGLSVLRVSASDNGLRLVKDGISKMTFTF